MLIPFGLKDGKICHINNVPNGLSCGCICPNCHGPLVAKNNGKRNQPHFAHAIDSVCLDTYSAMTYLHLYAQQILVSEKRLILPNFSYKPEIILLDGSILYGNEINFKSVEVIFDSVQSEHTWRKYRIDNYATIKDKQLFIEITVSHETEKEKIEAIKNSDISLLEIVLTDLHKSNDLHCDDLIKKAVFNPNNFRWIHNSKAIKEIEKENKRLKDCAKNKNRYVEMKIKREEDREQIRLQGRERERLRLRDEIKNEIEWLSQLDSEAIKKIEHINRNIIPAHLKNIEKTNYLEFIDIKLDGDWIFECNREYWQSLIISRIYDIGLEYIIETQDIKKLLLKNIKMNAYMSKLNIAQYQARERAMKNGSRTNHRMAWYLSREENKNIISPFKIVSDYLNYLARCGLLTTLRASSIYALNEWRMKSTNSRNSLRKRTFTKQEKVDRIQELIAADTLVFNDHDGSGVRCNHCHFVSPKIVFLSDGNCQICKTQSSYQDIYITQEYLDTAEDRYRCGIIPMKSLEKYS